MSSDPWGDLANSLNGVCVRFEEDRRTHEGFLQGSPAAVDVGDEPFAGDWGPAPARNANMAGLNLAFVAMDHLASLAVLLRSPTPPVCGPSAVGRSAMEVAARAHYLLDPGIPTLERIRRHQNDRLVTLWEQKQLAALAKQPSDEPDARVEAIFRSARRFGLTPRPSNKPPFIAPGPPNATDLIDDVVGKGDGVGAIYYKTLSAVTHGREHGMTQYLQRHAALLDRTHGDVLASFGTTPLKTARYLFGTLLAVTDMLDRLYPRFGWPATGVRRDVDTMLLVWVRIAEVTIPS
ncbi:hypothetical protein Kpho02_72400 [Kitasatospora phosalacinea]|uniref:Uncharacterized protein n=1 Tax=Kitasatospora phosalacinea TaxID=2065 RepID=A0A9W6V647_9ACTN|nr:hypothetical protein [Kitasatospora phosalacinea]GLW74943.1 hypothetical protein Kpho02_72400 [Kitasatospora phosalacinea]